MVDGLMLCGDEVYRDYLELAYDAVLPVVRRCQLSR